MREGGRVAIRAVKAKNRQKVRNDYPDQERKRDGEKERGVLEYIIRVKYCILKIWWCG